MNNNTCSPTDETTDTGEDVPRTDIHRISTIKSLIPQIDDLARSLQVQYQRDQSARATFHAHFASKTLYEDDGGDIETKAHPSQSSRGSNSVVQVQLDLESADREGAALLRLVNQFQDALKKLVTSQGLSGLEDYGSSLRDISDNGSTVHLAPEQEQYYDKANEVKWLGEDLVGLDLQHQDDLIERDLQVDRSPSYIPSVSDSDAERGYIVKRRRIEDALDRAIEEADRLKAICIDKQLPLETAFDPIPALETDSPDDGNGHSRDVMDLSPDQPPFMPPIEVEHITASRQNNTTPSPRVDAQRVLDWQEECQSGDEGSSLAELVGTPQISKPGHIDSVSSPDAPAITRDLPVDTDHEGTESSATNPAQLQDTHDVRSDPPPLWQRLFTRNVPLSPCNSQ